MNSKTNWPILAAILLVSSSCTEERKLYKEAIAGENRSALENFLQEYPESKYSGKIRERMDSLEFQKLEEAEDAEGLFQFAIARQESKWAVKAVDTGREISFLKTKEELGEGSGYESAAQYFTLFGNIEGGEEQIQELQKMAAEKLEEVWQITNKKEPIRTKETNSKRLNALENAQEEYSNYLLAFRQWSTKESLERARSISRELDTEYAALALEELNRNSNSEFRIENGKLVVHLNEWIYDYRKRYGRPYKGLSGGEPVYVYIDPRTTSKSVTVSPEQLKVVKAFNYWYEPKSIVPNDYKVLENIRLRISLSTTVLEGRNGSSDEYFLPIAIIPKEGEASAIRDGIQLCRGLDILFSGLEEKPGFVDAFSKQLEDEVESERQREAFLSGISRQLGRAIETVIKASGGFDSLSEQGASRNFGKREWECKHCKFRMSDYYLPIATGRECPSEYKRSIAKTLFKLGGVYCEFREPEATP